MKTLFLALLLTLVTACTTANRKGEDPDDINATIHWRKDDFRNCFDKQDAKTLPKKAALVTLDFSFDGQGVVTEATLKKTSLNHPLVEACLIEVMRSIRFPMPTSSGNVKVIYPFKYNPVE